MAVEPTFQFNAKNKNIILTDVRALAIRLNNLIAANSNGLPNNDEVTAGLRNFRMEEANTTTLALIREAVSDAISKYLKEGSPSVSVNLIDPPEGALVLRKMLQITVTVSNTGANGYSTIVMNLSQSAGRLVINDMNVV